MPIQVSSNAREVAERMRRRAARVFPALDRAAVEIRDLVESESRRQMDRLIYSKPVDFTPSGRPKWVRTQRLFLNEKARIVKGPDGNRVELRNTMRYARPRHEMGKPGTRRPKAKPYKRAAHWRDETVKVVRRAAAREYRLAQRRILLEVGVSFPRSRGGAL